MHCVPELVAADVSCLVLGDTVSHQAHHYTTAVITLLIFVFFSRTHKHTLWNGIVSLGGRAFMQFPFRRTRVSQFVCVCVRVRNCMRSLEIVTSDDRFHCMES